MGACVWEGSAGQEKLLCSAVVVAKQASSVPPFARRLLVSSAGNSWQLTEGEGEGMEGKMSRQAHKHI
jgi:hypothetical protein